VSWKSGRKLKKKPKIRNYIPVRGKNEISGNKPAKERYTG
jgi:hypothetical protein